MSGSSDGGKGDGARPLSVPWQTYSDRHDMIDWGKHKKQCGACQKPVDKCGCCPTEDGPGQVDEKKDEDSGLVCQKCPRASPYGDLVCANCLGKDDGRRGPDEKTSTMFANIHRNKERFSVEAVAKAFCGIAKRDDENKEDV